MITWKTLINIILHTVRSCSCELGLWKFTVFAATVLVAQWGGGGRCVVSHWSRWACLQSSVPEFRPPPPPPSLHSRSTLFSKYGIVQLQKTRMELVKIFKLQNSSSQTNGWHQGELPLDNNTWRRTVIELKISGASFVRFHRTKVFCHQWKVFLEFGKIENQYNCSSIAWRWAVSASGSAFVRFLFVTVQSFSMSSQP